MLKCMLSVITTKATKHAPLRPSLPRPRPLRATPPPARPSLAALRWSLFTHRLPRNAMHHAEFLPRRTPPGSPPKEPLPLGSVFMAPL